MVDELIREITEPGTGIPVGAKPAARGRLLEAVRSERRRDRQGLVFGSRGLVALIAALVIPTGAAVATELVRDEPFKSPSECPGLLAGIGERGLSTEGLVLHDCPVGGELDRLLDAMVLLRERRRQPEEGDGDPVDVQPVAGFGRSDDGEPWSSVGLAGEGDPGVTSDDGGR